MAKQNNLGNILKSRNPLERQAITPVDVLETERSNGSTEPNERTEQVNRTSTRTERPSMTSERKNRTVIDDLEQGTEDTKRSTERYSFEIYTDQKGSIEEVQYLYKKKTGKKLSSSRIIREAIDEYIAKTLKVLKD